MSVKRDYYEVLGITRSSTTDELKRQYRKLALKFHPDRNQHADTAEHFKEISEAYAVLSDAGKRQRYDQYGHAGINEQYSRADIFQGAQGGGFDGNDAWGWRNKGGSLYSLGRYDEAVTCYNESIRIDPDNPVVWNNKGLAQYHLGKYDEAILSYEQVIKIDPCDAEAWNNKGDALNSLGKKDEAKKCHDKSKELESDEE